MQFEYDPERLIDEVRKRPGIWDFDHIEYRARHVKQKLWAEIVKELNQNTGHATKSELRELELQLQKKWKSIRDCYQKYLSNPNKTKRPYIYSKKLSFLLKEQDVPKPQAQSSDSDDEKVRPKLVWKKTIKVKTQNSDDEDNNDDCNNEEYSNNDSDNDYEEDVDVNVPPPAKVAKYQQRQPTDLFAFANVDSVPKQDDNDPERLFLLSLLPHLKTIPEEIRLNVKMEMMQVLQNANYASTRQHKII